MYAVREVARYQNDKVSRDRITLEILALSFILCLLGYVAVIILAIFVPQIQEQSALFFILSLSILFTSIGADWFYQATENFRFITIRALIIRAVSAACLFIFVKSEKDLLFYGIIFVGSTVGNSIFNFVYLRKQIQFSCLTIKKLKITHHLKPSLQIFMLNVITSLYLQLNSVMLGFMTDDDQVGYFTAGTRISQISLTLITSLSTVLIPRCSHLIKEGNLEGFGKIINKSLNVTMSLAYPMALGLMVLAVPVTLIFCGDEYMDSIPVLLFNAPLIAIISLTNVMANQTLYPMGKMKEVIICVSGGAVTNIIFNFLLIPYFQATGTAIATLLAESAVCGCLLVIGKSYYPFDVKKIFKIQYLIPAIVMVIAIYPLSFILENKWILLVVGVTLGFVVYTLLLFLRRDPMVEEFKSFLRRKRLRSGIC